MQLNAISTTNLHIFTTRYQQILFFVTYISVSIVWWSTLYTNTRMKCLGISTVAVVVVVPVWQPTGNSARTTHSRTTVKLPRIHWQVIETDMYIIVMHTSMCIPVTLITVSSALNMYKTRNLKQRSTPVVKSCQTIIHRIYCFATWWLEEYSVE